MATQTRNPTSDEAASGTWSGSAGTRWQLVDDYPDSSGADILTGGTTAAVITFGFSAFSIPAGSTSISVQVLYYDGEAANGANNCGGRLKVGGSYFNAATHNPAGTTYTSRSDNWATNPKTATAWTVDDINGVGANALQAFGMNSTDSNPTWRFSSIQLQVTYTPPAATTLDIATSSPAQAMSAGSTVTRSIGAASLSPAQTFTASVTVTRSIAMASSAAAQASSMTMSVGEMDEVTVDLASTAAAQQSSSGTVVTASLAMASAAAAQQSASSAHVTATLAVASTSPAQVSEMATTLPGAAAPKKGVCWVTDCPWLFKSTYR